MLDWFIFLTRAVIIRGIIVLLSIIKIKAISILCASRHWSVSVQISVNVGLLPETDVQLLLMLAKGVSTGQGWQLYNAVRFCLHSTMHFQSYASMVIWNEILPVPNRIWHYSWTVICLFTGSGKSKIMNIFCSVDDLLYIVGIWLLPLS